MVKFGDRLTERERRVVNGMVAGKTNAEIGRELSISQDTVKTHARALFVKLRARNRTEAAATWLLNNGASAGPNGSGADGASLLVRFLGILPSAGSVSVSTLADVYGELIVRAEKPEYEVTGVTTILIKRAGPGGILVRICCLLLEELELLERDRETRQLFMVDPKPTFEKAVQAKFASFSGDRAESYRLLFLALMAGSGGSLLEMADAYKGLVVRD